MSRFSLKSLSPLFPPVTLNLMIICFITWVAEIALGHLGINLPSIFGLHYWGANDFKLYQLFTYIFLHDPNGLDHIFFNMFSLWMFGALVERFWGKYRYLFFFLTCGLTAALTQEIIWMITMPTQPLVELTNGHMAAIDPSIYENLLLTVGASGSIFGLLLAYGLLFPNSYVFVSFIIPVKAKYFVILYALIELFYGVYKYDASVAHFAHLGGMIGGLILYIIWRRRGEIDGPYN